MTSSSHNPLPSCSNQDQRFALAFSILEDAIASQAFPGTTASIAYCGEIVALKAFGHFIYDPDSLAVEPGTIYDIASVTKVVATTTVAMILYDRGALDLDALVTDFFPEFATEPEKQRVTLRMLLAHSSGLPAYEKLYKHAATREELIRLAVKTPLTAAPLSRAEYSDIGFILLGEILARLAGQPLDTFCVENIFQRLQMSSTRFHPREDWRAHIPPTIDDRDFRHRVIQGEVHDENASVMGGVSGHAGVFSNAGDLAKFGLCMLRGGSPIVKPSTLELFTRRETLPAGTSRALGWDTPSSPSQSGQLFSPGSFGHLGYTGTSIWCDPVRQLCVTLLTNRVWPDCSSQAIKYVRPKFHDAVLTALEV